MYVIKKSDDGHSWSMCSNEEQPIHGQFEKLYCVYCGAKAYTVGEDKVSLTGEYYSGEIRECPNRFMHNNVPIKRKKKKKKNKLHRIDKILKRIVK